MKLFRVAIGIFLLISMFAAPASSGCINVDFEIKKGSRQFIYDASSYMLSSFINKMDDMSTDNKWAFSLDCNAMVPEQVAVFQNFSASQPFTFPELRDVTTLYYNDNRIFRHFKRPIPNTLEEFIKTFDFYNWTEKTLVKNSSVKGFDRAIYRFEDVSVAQTMAIDENGTEYVRETEVIIKREDDKNYSFFVYDEAGDLSNKSEFINGSVEDAPFVCMNCHYDPRARAFVP
ncbi:MAG: hypothetical protein KBD78_06000 [Oligoflexales bacterium]|nr:hypothetical protein [Oligoflexales bacterium]